MVMLKTVNENVTMSLTVNNKQLSKNYNKTWGKNWKANEDKFWSKPVYGDNDKYIKNKNKNICRQYDYKFP